MHSRLRCSSSTQNATANCQQETALRSSCFRGKQNSEKQQPPAAKIRSTSVGRSFTSWGLAGAWHGGKNLRQAQGYASESGNSKQEEEAEAREVMEYDVVIVGAGPAGLAAAIRLKQLCQEKGTELTVCVLEKASEVGAHILSGNVFEPRALNELIPDWKEQNAPLWVPVTKDKFWLLSEKYAFPVPSPFKNQGNFVISLSELVRWLGTKAEELGVEIYPGFAASEVLYEGARVVGVATNDMGIAKSGSRKPNFQRGIELKGRLTLLAEGCRGSLSETVIKKFQLREEAGAQHQTYAIGLKEVWEVEEHKHHPGYVLHTVGWPLNFSTYGGSFLYHMDNQQVAIGLVVALDYKNPYMNPYEEYQRFKQHPSIRPLLEGGKVVQYGARTLNEGGLQSIPRTVFPGGALIGCTAGFVNVPKIKGSHTAMKTGILAAEAAHEALSSMENPNMDAYWEALQHSWVWQELYSVRNIRPFFHHGLLPGLVHAGLDHYVIRGRLPYTLAHGPPDHECTEAAEKHKPIQYPKPDGVITFDLLTSLYRSSTNHEHDQPPHLHLVDKHVPETINLPKFAAPESRYCPARVYEYIANEDNKLQLNINAQNCLHCKACDIKDPKQNIKWTVPEGGGGPGYTIM